MDNLDKAKLEKLKARLLKNNKLELNRIKAKILKNALFEKIHDLKGNLIGSGNDELKLKVLAESDPDTLLVLAWSYVPNLVINDDDDLMEIRFHLSDLILKRGNNESADS